MEDSQRRFQSVMDKLFSAPKSWDNSSSSSGGQPPRGRKRPNPGSAFSGAEPKSGVNIQETPLCRPWDRGDLMRRLATFKSMTWFAKPKVVNAVNCARRGWINVETDTLACESCGARLLFTTPSSWAQQQVDKAALVFSLKLDNGHKLLCPWMDNVCEERLMQFPPTTAPELSDGYRQRSSSLLQLSALPLISSSAADYMRSPQLEQFLAQSITLGNDSTGTSAAECFGNDYEEASANLYYQAQKLISLCGWTPRTLSYVVECKDKFKQPVKDGSLSESSHAALDKDKCSISVYASATKGTLEANDLGGHQSDPNAVVLNCSFCGASVGLWAFSMVSRPVELLRLVRCAEVNGNEPRQIGYVTGEGVENATSSNADKSRQNLGLTIAGGPSPTKQNFKAKISLPIVGQNLRARLFSGVDSRGLNMLDMSGSSQQTTGSGERPVSRQAIQSESLLSNNGSVDTLDSSFTGGNESSLMDNNISAQGNALSCEIIGGKGVEEINSNEAGTDDQNSTVDIPEGSSQRVQDMDQDDKLPETEGNIESCIKAPMGFSTSQVNDLSMKTTVSNACNMEGDKYSTSVVTVIDHSKHLAGSDTASKNEITTGHQQPSHRGSCLGNTQVDSGKGACSSNARSSSGEQVKDQNDRSKKRVKDQNGEVKNREQPHTNNEDVFASAKGLSQCSDNTTGFDPIRQHRHFCPWIATSDSAPPGWKQTLAAVQQREFLDSSPLNSSSIIEVDDPITSIRTLFMSPAKRRKPSHEST